MRPPLIAVATMMGGQGPTGVETHFNQILRSAESKGYQTKLITPYTGQRIVRAFFRPLKNRRDEFSAVLYRSAQSWVIRSQLAALRRQSTQPVTVYAQCPLTAGAALKVAPSDESWRVVLVVHFNGSEIAEVLEKGIARPGGRWCQHLDQVEKAVLPNVGKIVFVSDYMRRVVNERLPEIARVPQETIPNFPPKPTREPDAPRSGDLIAIGTLEPRKNQAFILEVLAKARDLGAKYSLSIVGEGPDRGRLEKLCRDLELDDQVRFLGFRADAARLIPEYRVLVHAARMENCPITLIEGLSYGRPLLAAAVGGIPEIFQDGVEGFFWDLRDPAQAAGRMMTLLGTPQKYALMSEAARERYHRDFAQLPDRWVGMLTGNSVAPTAIDAAVIS